LIQINYQLKVSKVNLTNKKFYNILLLKNTLIGVGIFHLKIYRNRSQGRELGRQNK